MLLYLCAGQIFKTPPLAASRVGSKFFVIEKAGNVKWSVEV